MEQQSHAIWQEARDVLDNARQWRHHDPADWAVLDGHLNELETAACQGDVEAATAATTELELMSPLRCDHPRKAGATGIPDGTLDFLNHVDALIKEALDEAQ